MLAVCHSWVADSKTDIMLGYQGSFNFRFGGRPHSMLLLSFDYLYRRDATSIWDYKVQFHVQT